MQEVKLQMEEFELKEYRIVKSSLLIAGVAKR